MILKHKYMILHAFIVSLGAFAPTHYTEASGGFARIPLKNVTLMRPSVDLFCDIPACKEFMGKTLNEDEIRLLLKRKSIPDTSLLNPTPNTIVWADKPENSPFKDMFPLDLKNTQELGLSHDNESFSFLNIKPDGFNNTSSVYVSRNNSQGVKEFFNIRLGPLVHNDLLRKGILRKIGYLIPPSQYLNTFKIEFTGAAKIQKRELLLDIYRKTLKNPADWITNINRDAVACILNPPETTEENVPNPDLEKCNQLTAAIPNTFEFRDAVLYKGIDDSTYNLSRGSLEDEDSNIILGRRVLGALIIPYSITNSVPQLNLMEWIPARVANKSLFIPWEEGAAFSNTSIDDAKWIMRRIAKLQRQDFEEIVKNSFFKIDEYEKLLTEKLIVRRNFYVKYLGLEKEFTQIPTNTELNSNSIKNGLLIADVCKGINALTCWEPSPESPLDLSEKAAFAKSIFNSNVIEKVVTEFNERAFENVNTDMGKALFDRQLDLAAKQFADYIIDCKTNPNCKPKRIPFNFWGKSYFGAKGIVSRNIVIGSFLGADNTIQLADTIGFEMNAGYFINTEGLPIKEQLTGDLKGTFAITYTHLKGTYSIKEALNEPLKNIYVPSFKRKRGHMLEDLFEENLEKELGKEELKLLQSAKEKFEQGEPLDPDEYKNTKIQNKINSVLKEFKDNLGVNESIIVSKTFIPNGNIGYLYNLAKDVNARAFIMDRLQRISRLHVYRKNENTFQVFKDFALMNSYGGGISLDYYNVTGISGDIGRGDGKASTQFFTLNLNPDISQNPYVLDHVRSLSQVLLSNKVNHLKESTEGSTIKNAYNYHKVDHKFKIPMEANGKILVFEGAKQKLYDEVAIKTPSGFEKNLVMRSTGSRWGINYQDFFIQVLNAWINTQTEWDFDVITPTNGNPADTIAGKAISRRAAFEAVGKNEISKQYGVVEYAYRGWSSKQKRIVRLIKEIEERYSFELFPEETLKNMEKIELYNLLVTVNFYESSIDHMALVSEKDLKEIFQNHSLVKLKNNHKITVGKFIKAQHEYLKAKSQNPEEASKWALVMIDKAEALLNRDGLTKITGGFDNIFVQATLNGFKVGDPRGAEEIIANSSGEINSLNAEGPFKDIMRKLGINTGEFYIYWLINKL